MEYCIHTRWPIICSDFVRHLLTVRHSPSLFLLIKYNARIVVSNFKLFILQAYYIIGAESKLLYLLSQVLKIISC